MVGVVSPVSLGVVVVEGPIALTILFAGLGLGVELLRVFGVCGIDGDGAHPAAERLASRAANRLVVASGLGLGALSLIVLGAGVMGWMNRGVWIGVVGVLGARGILEVVRVVRGGNGTNARGGWIWVVPGVFFGLSLLCASLPPGILWPAEGNGYDVLEYHLGALRDYLDAGRVEFLPHNIYNNFPFGVEMLYLLGMILRGDPLRAGITAQLLHAMLGFLAAGATWCTVRAALRDAERSRRSAAHIAGIAVATCPFVLYVGALAYVENGLLLYTALALAAIIEAGRVDQSRPARWFALAGVMVGFAFGCKYIAAVQVVIPLGLAVFWVASRKRRGGGGVRSILNPHPGPLPRGEGIKALAAYGVAALLTMSPWLIRNAVNTGNPVFPLARSLFAEKAGVWNDDGAARWAEGHLPGPEHRSVGGRMKRLRGQVFRNPLYGPVMGIGGVALVAGLLRVLLPRSRSYDPPIGKPVREGESGAGDVRSCVVVCGVLLVGALSTWIGFTHLVDRFAMVALIPAAVLIAVVFGSLFSPLARRAIATLLVVANMGLMVYLLFSTSTFDLLKARDSVGITWFTEGEWPTHQHVPKLNEIVGGGGKVLMVADARRFYLDRGVDYCVVFNRNPFAEAAERMSPKDLIAWLRESGYTHVFVNWSEMARLRGSRYGFWKAIDGELFKRMMDAGLTVAAQFAFDQERAPYGTLYTIAPR